MGRKQDEERERWEAWATQEADAVITAVGLNDAWFHYDGGNWLDWPDNAEQIFESVAMAEEYEDVLKDADLITILTLEAPDLDYHAIDFVERVVSMWKSRGDRTFVESGELNGVERKTVYTDTEEGSVRLNTRASDSHTSIEVSVSRFA